MSGLIRFFLLAYGISWALWAPLWGPAVGIHGLPVLPFHHALGGLGPMIAALVCTGLENGPRGVRALLLRTLWWRPIIYFLIALLAPFVLLLAGMAMVGSVDLSGLLRNKEFPDMGLPLFFVYNLIFFGFGEETGWRGFALPRLQRRMNPLWASLLLTLPWALWHAPLFLYRPGYTAMDVGGAAGWFFSLLTGSVLLSWLFNATRGSLLVVAIFHATVDIAFTCEAATPSVVGNIGMLITLWGIGTTVLLWRSKGLVTDPLVQRIGNERNGL
ncbi:MAG: CPBP family intramembrane metalloprotease [Flavobacteriales bacterium]|nr:CPBP family intramembrane metalloprotease [Flavobacteriales bacterium]